MPAETALMVKERILTIDTSIPWLPPTPKEPLPFPKVDKDMKDKDKDAKKSPKP